jgi:hypothetical protein
VKRTAAFALASVGVIGLLGGLLLLVFPGAASARAIAWSAGVALLVQLAAFTILRRMRSSGAVMIGWGLGSLLRLTALALYAFVAVRSLGFPAVPALVSLATFLFATMFLEPFLLET